MFLLIFLLPLIWGNPILRTIFGVVVVVGLVLVAYLKWSRQYWKRRNLPTLKSQFLYGHLQNPLRRKESFGDILKKLYDEARTQGLKHCGLYSLATPIYYVIDLDYIRNVMSKDFQYFVDRGIYYNERDDPLSAHIFNLGGAKWRNLRTKLTPTFTSGKMKNMFQTLVDCQSSLELRVEKFYRDGEALDIKEILGCFTTDIIGSCAFGLDCNTFKDEDSPFRRYGRRIFKQTRTSILRRMFAGNLPQVAKAVGLTVVNKEVSKFFMKVVKDTVEYRETHDTVRKDFLQLLIDLKNNKLEGGPKNVEGDGNTLTINEVAAQCFIFFIAGFETSSTTMTFALYEMARHPEIQERVRKEIRTVLAKHNNQVTYEAINEMKYMSQVIDETLRFYPPVPFLTRECVKDYKLPDQDVIIEKGTRVFIPILGIHHDKEIYENPEKFDPERFTEENKKGRHPYAHIPFGEGPRICIGMRFGLMQSKVGLTSLLKNYKFSVNSKTKEPLKMAANSFVSSAEGEIWLNAEKIQ